MQRPDWREEKKLNKETFGVPGNHGGYRGRGRGGPWSGNRRGGYYGGYRGGSGGGGGENKKEHVILPNRRQLHCPGFEPSVFKMIPIFAHFFTLASHQLFLLISAYFGGGYNNGFFNYGGGGRFSRDQRGRGGGGNGRGGGHSRNF